MKPKESGKNEYTAMCRGLERMAALYKEKKRYSNKEQVSSSARRVFHSVKKHGVQETFRRYRISKSGVDRILSNSEGETADWELLQAAHLYFSSERIAVYMAEFGGYDEIMEPVIHPDNIDY